MCIFNLVEVKLQESAYQLMFSIHYDILFVQLEYTRILKSLKFKKLSRD